MKTCIDCHIEKIDDDFYHVHGRPGKTPRCKPCHKIKKDAWIKENPDKVRAYIKTSYAKDRDKKCAYSRAYAQRWPERHAAQQRKQRRKMKLAAFAAYGGNVCVCCGETEIAFLSIDHINGGGIKHRKITGAGNLFYRWLNRNEYPEGYRVMCHNCNHGREINGGICPHVSKMVSAAVPA